MRKKTNQEWINDFIKIHNYKYDYSLFDINKKNNEGKCCIICHEKDDFGNEHGEFWQTPDKHKQKRGCPKCKQKKLQKYNIEQFEKCKLDFEEKAKKIHGENYVYKDVIYTGNNKKVKIFCKKCNEYFFITPNSHLRGCGCKKCSINKRNNDILKNSKNSFNEKAIEVHKGFYSYDKINYEKSNKKVIVTCPIHGDFLITPNHHLNGEGCPKCAKIKLTLTLQKLANEKLEKHKNIFVTNSNKKHNNFYVYDKSVYINDKKKLIVTCPVHGDFLITPNHHLGGCGCPICSGSKGEKEIIFFLEKNNINYIYQAKKKDFDWLGLQSLDFYLPDYNIAIEYQGEQHFKPCNFGSKTISEEKSFENCKKRDKIKLEKCIKHNLPLHYINYNENIEIKLKEILEL